MYEVLKNTLRYLPSNIGHIAKTLAKPLLEYWPKAISKNNKEYPIRNVNVMYNHKNVPRNKLGILYIIYLLQTPSKLFTMSAC